MHKTGMPRGSAARHSDGQFGLYAARAFLIALALLALATMGRFVLDHARF
jgi:hypothetical protein